MVLIAAFWFSVWTTGTRLPVPRLGSIVVVPLEMWKNSSRQGFDSQQWLDNHLILVTTPYYAPSFSIRFLKCAPNCDVLIMFAGAQQSIIYRRIYPVEDYQFTKKSILHQGIWKSQIQTYDNSTARNKKKTHVISYQLILSISTQK